MLLRSIPMGTLLHAILRMNILLPPQRWCSNVGMSFDHPEIWSPYLKHLTPSVWFKLGQPLSSAWVTRSVSYTYAVHASRTRLTYLIAGVRYFPQCFYSLRCFYGENEWTAKRRGSQKTFSKWKISLNDRMLIPHTLYRHKKVKW